MSKIKICLDAGHDKGYNPSPCGYGYYEGTRMFEYQAMLKRELEKYGFEIVCTRQKVEDNPDLMKRANRGSDCDLILSLHSNAVGDDVNETVDYVRVYYPISGVHVDLAKKLSECIAEVMGTKQMPQYISRFNSTKNADYYGIIRYASALGVPAFILEHSFHTNSRTTQWLMSDGNLLRLAKTTAKTLAEYYGMEEVLTMENFEKMFDEYMKKLNDNDSGEWSSEARKWAVSHGIIAGIGDGADGKPNYAWEAPLTREQFVTMLYRFANFLNCPNLRGK